MLDYGNQNELFRKTNKLCDCFISILTEYASYFNTCYFPNFAVVSKKKILRNQQKKKKNNRTFKMKPQVLFSM